MLAQRNPQAAYARVAFDARISAANPRELVTMCYEQLISALGSALIAADRGDNALKSASLTRAVSALTALQIGISGEEGVADALRQFYSAARRAVLDSVLSFDAKVLASIRQDFIDIARATGGGES
ncbi:MAG: flagellar protein FliS [Proteobacteria bacterium]|nr:flagellar protein FliS [Pseudomonadota bacterium]